jgi:hypothetical protein
MTYRESAGVKEFVFDVTIKARVGIEADDEEAARQLMRYLYVTAGPHSVFQGITGIDQQSTRFRLSENQPEELGHE